MTDRPQKKPEEKFCEMNYQNLIAQIYDDHEEYSYVLSICITDSELGYEPQIDVDRFRRLLALAEAETKKTKRQPADRASEDQRVDEITRRLAQGSLGEIDTFE